MKKEEAKKKKTQKKMLDPNPATSKFALTFNDINFTINEKIARIKKKMQSNFIILWETYFKYKDTDWK